MSKRTYAVAAGVLVVSVAWALVLQKQEENKQAAKAPATSEYTVTDTANRLSFQYPSTMTPMKDGNTHTLSFKDSKPGIDASRNIFISVAANPNREDIKQVYSGGRQRVLFSENDTYTTRVIDGYTTYLVSPIAAIGGEEIAVVVRENDFVEINCWGIVDPVESEKSGECRQVLDTLRLR